MKIISISLDEVIPNISIAKTVIDENGEVLLYKGALLCEPTIKRLKKAGISTVYVYEESLKITQNNLNCKPVKPLQENIIPKILLKQAVNIVNNIFQNPKTVNYQQIVNIVSNIVNEIVKNKTTIVPIQTLRSYDNYTYEHSVNVAILGITLGKILEYSTKELKILGIGLLLHDFGKIAIPLEILNKPGKLTDEEFQIIKTHPTKGLELLEKLYNLEHEAKLIVKYHHERLNGNGYPEGLKEASIHKFAKIAAIVDVYDALTSDRIYKPKLPVKQALQILINGINKEFDPYLLKKFLLTVPIEEQEFITFDNTIEETIKIQKNENESELELNFISIDEKE